MIRLLIVLSAVFSTAGGFFYMYYFRVSSIKTNLTIPASYKEELYRQTLPLVNEEGIKKEIMRQNPLVAEVRVEKKYPRELVITMKKTKAIAQLKNGNSYIELDERARVLATGKKENKKLMPIVFYQPIPEFEIALGRELKRAEVKYAVQLTGKINIDGFHLKKIVVKSPQTLTLESDIDEPLVILSTKKDIDKNLILLHNSIKAFTISGEKAKVINLQFSKPFIEYENTSGN